MNITPVKKNFVFQFKDAVNSKGEFNKSATDSGIILQSSFDESAKQSRWVNVVAAGPNCDQTICYPGAEVLLPALRWTESSKLDGQKIWKSDETQVAAYVVDGEVVPRDGYVVFTQNTHGTVTKSATGLLIVVGGVEDTATGTVVSVGSTVSEELGVGDKILYNDANFNDTFEHNGTKYAFIKEDDILAYEPV